MASTKFQKGVVLQAKAFERGQEFTVEVLASQPVAEGASSRIYLGQAALGRKSHRVALKLLERELRTVRHIKHPFILPYLGTAVFEFHKILVSEYMPGGNLLEFLKTHALHVETLVIQVGLALRFLHEKKRLVHGDVKCENVLVSNQDGRPTALLADFGLSTVIDKTGNGTRTATALRQQASLQFAAPELLFGETEPGRPVRKTPQTDVYAFGMLVVQAFSGRPPWPGCGAPEIIMKVQSRIPHPRPQANSAGLPLADEWWDVCLKCWAHEPAQRPRMRTVVRTLDQSARKATRWGTCLPFFGECPSLFVTLLVLAFAVGITPVLGYMITVQQNVVH